MKFFLTVPVIITAIFCSDKPVFKHYSEQQQSGYYKPLSKFKGDTSGYLLDNFVYHRQIENGQSFKSFIQKLEVRVVSINPLLNGPDMPEGCYGLELSFYPNSVIEKKIKEKKEPAILVIYWQNLLEENPSIDFLKRHTPVKQVVDYYSEREDVIKKITYVSYYHDKILKDSSIINKRKQ